MKCEGNSNGWKKCPLKNGYEESSGELPFYGVGILALDTIIMKQESANTKKHGGGSENIMTMNYKKLKKELLKLLDKENKSGKKLLWTTKGLATGVGYKKATAHAYVRKVLNDLYDAGIIEKIHRKPNLWRKIKKEDSG